MKLVLSLVVVLFAVNSQAEYVWRTGVPNHVQLVNGGLVVLGEFSNTPSENTISCNSAHLDGFYLPSSDTEMDRKLSMALMALASGKKLQAHIADTTVCTHVSAVGSLPVAHSAYWTIKN